MSHLIRRAVLSTLVILPLVGQAQASSPPPFPSLAPMLAQVSPSVVNISVQGTVEAEQNPMFQDPLFRKFFNLPEGAPNQPQKQEFQAVGSGVVFDAGQGYILTNSHLIENADKIMVTFKDQKQSEAKLIGADAQSDLAVLKVKPDHMAQIVFADSDKLQVGDFVAAIGSPFGLGQTATFGIVSAVGRSGLGIESYEDFIQTDASINPGNSGGALVDMSGSLVGINTAILSRSGGSVGIGFAIPSNMAHWVAERLIAYGKIARGQLGVLIQNLSPAMAKAMNLTEARGAVVSQVISGSPAALAGLKAGDVIRQLNGESVEDAAALRNRIGMLPPGAKVTLDILRDGKPRTLTATLAEQRAQPAEDGGADMFRGAKLGPIPAGNPLYNQTQGLYVVSVAPGSSAAQAGLQAGDVIVSADNQATTNVAQLKELAAKDTERQRPILLQVARGDGSLFIAVE